MKIFHTYIKKYQCITPERLYGDYREYIQTDFTTTVTSIYFIVKCDSANWLINSFKIGNDYKVNGYILFEGKKQKVTIDMADFWYAMPIIQEKFANKYDMANYFMSRSQDFPWRFLPNQIKYRFLSNANKTKSSNNKLVIDCELSKNINTEKVRESYLYIYQAINHFDLPVPKLEIIYIGSSVSNPFSRLDKHDKWGIIHSQRQKNEDILIYFAELNGDIIERHLHSDLSIISRNDHHLGRREETLITEMALINHFKPKYNDKHVQRDQRDIRFSKLVKKNLIDKGYTEINVEVLLEGPLGRIGTAHLGQYGEHLIKNRIV